MERGLGRFLRYSCEPRRSFHGLLVDPARTHADYEMLHLEEHPGFAGGAFQVRTSAPHDAELLRADDLAPTAGAPSDSHGLLLTKRFSFGPAPRGCEVAC